MESYIGKDEKSVTKFKLKSAQANAVPVPQGSFFKELKGLSHEN